MSDRPALIQSILREGREETAKVVEEAARAAGSRTDAAEKQCRRILEEAELTAGERIARVEQNAASRLAVDVRREQLRVRDALATRAVEGARSRVAEMREGPGYRQIVIDWIVEAAVGLGAERAEVNATAAELTLIDGDLLGEAEGEVAQLTGREVKLLRSQSPPLLAQGVVLARPDGRVAYSNQVETRILRLQSQIRALILGELIEEQ